MKKLIIAILLSVLVICTSCGKKTATTPTTAATTTDPAIKELQAQIDDLSLHVYAQSSILTRVQAQLKANSMIIKTPVITTPTTISTLPPTPVTPTTPTGPSNVELAKQIEFLTSNIQNLGDKMSALEDQMQTLQQNLVGNATNIGLTSTSVNGLGILFITNNIDVGTAGTTSATSAQFAIKITNTTNSIISNLDITGLITTPSAFTGTLAAGYPQVTDASGNATITSTYAGDRTVVFEAYGGAKGLTLPVGGSITLRPKISIMAAANNKIAATTFTIAINAITFDKQPLVLN